MKKIIGIILVCFLGFCLLSCSNDSGGVESHKFDEVNKLINNGEYAEAYKKLEEFGSDSEAEKMKNRFRNVCVKVEGNNGAYTQTVYDAANYKVEYRYTDETGNKCTSYLTYNSNGNITMTEDNYIDGSYQKKEFVYDEKGRCIKETTKISDDYEDGVTTTEYSYDENGNCINQKVTQLDGYKRYHINETENGIEKEVDVYDEEIEITYYTYDEDGNRISAHEDFAEEGSWEYTYDSVGKLIKKSGTNFHGEPGNNFYREYIYDENQNLIREELRDHYDSYELDEYTEYSYNTNGDLTEKVITDVNQDSKTSYSYKYDENGKLIEFIYSGNDGNYKLVRKFIYDKNGNVIEMHHSENYDYGYSEGFSNEFSDKYTYGLVYFPVDSFEELDYRLATTPEKPMAKAEALCDY